MKLLYLLKYGHSLVADNSPIFLILQIATILATIFLGVMTVISNMKLQRQRNISSVETSNRIKRFDTFSTIIIDILNYANPLTTIYNYSKKTETISKLSLSVASLKTFFYRIYTKDFEMMVSSEKILELMLAIFEEYDHNNFEIPHLLSELHAEVDFFLTLVEIYRYTDWARIKREAKGISTKTEEWFEIYAVNSTKFQEFSEGQKLIDRINFHDYHMHTTASDGELSYRELLEFASGASLETIAICDHDTIDAWYLNRETISASIEVIPAVEITCRTSNFGLNNFSGAGIHMLGYGLHQNLPELKKRLDARKAKQRKIMVSFTQTMHKYGCSLHFDEIVPAWGTLIQVSDILKLIDVDKTTLSAAEYAKLVATLKLDLDACNFTTKEAIAFIAEHGGISVWAHPFNYYKDEKAQRLSKEQLEQIGAVLQTEGLNGIESFYGHFSFNDQRYLASLAEKMGLLSSSGSDFHNLVNRKKTINRTTSLAYRTADYFAKLTEFIDVISALPRPD